MKMDDIELKEYFNNIRLKKDKNKGRSFTYGSFLYDMLIENRIDENSRIYQEIYERVLESAWYNPELGERINNKVIAELLDISELDDVIRYYEKYMQGEADCYGYNVEEYAEDFDKNFTFID